jgi:hypothetical protein
MRFRRLLFALFALTVISFVGIYIARAVGVLQWNSLEPRVMHLEFPSQQEINTKTVSATSEEKADGMKWITGFLKPAAMPDKLEEHLLAVRDAIPIAHAVVIGSGYSGTPPGGMKMTSGFITKYEISGYAIQVMETRGEVIVGIQDTSTASAKTSQTDRLRFVQDIIEQFIKPQPADPFIIPMHQSSATYGAYSPVKQLAGPEGNYALDPKQMRQSLFRDIKFSTDGKGVIFEAHKNFITQSANPAPRFTAPISGH